MIINRNLTDDEQTLALGAALATGLKAPLTIYLRGGLGMGKTTLSRGLVQALGHQGAVKSPTYALVEAYEFTECRLFHFDLYRLQDPEELEFMGIRDYFADDCVCLVEWPERGFGLLPPADIIIQLEDDGHQGRHATLQGQSAAGRACLEALKEI